MPNLKNAQTMLDRFAKLYHDRNAARDRFARLDKPKYTGEDPAKHQRWKQAVNELAAAEDALLKAKVDRYNDFLSFPPYSLTRHGEPGEPFDVVFKTVDTPTRSYWGNDDGIDVKREHPRGHFVLVEGGDEYLDNAGRWLRRPGRSTSAYKYDSWTSRVGDPRRNRYIANMMGDKGYLYTYGSTPDLDIALVNGARVYGRDAILRDWDEAMARQASAERAWNSIDADYKMYREWHNGGKLFSGPRPEDMEFVDAHGRRHRPEIDPYFDNSPYHRRGELTPKEYADLTNGL